MNPYSRFKKWIIGDTLASTEDVFKKVRIDVLFSFTLFFFITNIPYVFVSLSISAFHTGLAVFSLLGLLTILVMLRTTHNLRLATFFYISVHCILNITHFIMNNGKIEAQGILFFMLVVLFSFLMLGRSWGFFLTFFVIGMFLLGNYNINSGYSIFKVPSYYNDPNNPQTAPYLMLIPLLLNIYLVSQFVKANQKAEKRIHHQNAALEISNKNLESKNEDILSSIHYAKRIQEAVLPPEDRVQRDIPLSFIFYRPKDIVSGDFFWFHSIDKNHFILAVADCTGHGVPGAFMTVIGSNLLNQVVIENNILSPGKILSELDHRLTFTLRQEKQHRGLVQDGMDIAIIYVDRTKNEIRFSSAKRPAIFVRDGKLEEQKGSKLSIGGLRTEEKIFSELILNYQEDDCIYLYSDGMVDQFGGAQNKKLTSKRLREKILEISEFQMHDQSRQIEELFQSWKGSNEQTDDALMIGIRF
jgi:serine phosphatase RsbU (regulator of sigma subunit)